MVGETLVIPAIGTKADAPAPAGKVERPAWLPDKFATPEDLVKSYGELETKLGTTTKTEPVVKSTPLVIKEAVLSPEQLVAKAGLDMLALSKEYQENDGKLSDASIAALNKAGIPTTTIETFVKGAEAQAQLIVTEMTKVAGGEQQLAQVFDWARANMSQAERDEYNAAINQNNPGTTKLVFEGLYARYQAATGSEPQLIGGSSRAAEGAEGYQSRAEMTRAMRDPRYASDPAYRKGVEKKTGATDFSKVQ